MLKLCDELLCACVLCATAELCRLQQLRPDAFVACVRQTAELCRLQQLRPDAFVACVRHLTELTVINDCGHLITSEQPQAAAAMLGKLL